MDFSGDGYYGKITLKTHCDDVPCPTIIGGVYRDTKAIRMALIKKDGNLYLKLNSGMYFVLFLLNE